MNSHILIAILKKKIQLQLKNKIINSTYIAINVQ